PAAIPGAGSAAPVLRWWRSAERPSRARTWRGRRDPPPYNRPMNAPPLTALRRPAQDRPPAPLRSLAQLTPDDGFGRLGNAFHARLDAVGLPEPFLVAASAPAAG